MHNNPSGLHLLSQLVSNYDIHCFQICNKQKSSQILISNVYCEICCHLNFGQKCFSWSSKITKTKATPLKSSLLATFPFAVKAKYCSKSQYHGKVHRSAGVQKSFLHRDGWRPSRKYDLTKRRPRASRGTLLMVEDKMSNKAVWSKKVQCADLVSVGWIFI